MPDPIGEIIEPARSSPSGIQRRPACACRSACSRMIYESRPNVTIEAASLAIKSGNACILRGGSEALASNLALAAAGPGARSPRPACRPTRCSSSQTTDRAAVGHLIASPESVDVIIPRGGKGLIERIAREAKVPVIKHLDGNCHVYVDAERRPGDGAARSSTTPRRRSCSPCNAAESLLVHAAIARALPADDRRACSRRRASRCAATPRRSRAARRRAGAKLVAATEADWAEEYLAPIISIKVVDSLDAAIAHIDRYGSHHTDAIVTDSHANAMRFLREVDSASVMVNASTRFADGFEYGLGAEIGISHRQAARARPGRPRRPDLAEVDRPRPGRACVALATRARALVLFSGGQDSTVCLA